MNLSTRSTRTIAAVGAVVAAATATFMAVAAGTASADEPGHCLQNVNVREEADATSKIVAMCETGTQVTIGPERDGWAYLENLHGWASREFIKSDGPSAPPARDAGASGEASATPSATSSGSSSSSSNAPRSSSSSERAGSDEATGDDTAGDRAADSGSGTHRTSGSGRLAGQDLGGLLH